MYHRSDTPFGGAAVRLQTISVEEDRVQIRPNAVAWAIAGLLVIFFCVAAGTWVLNRLDGIEHLPDLTVLCVLLAVLTLALCLFWRVWGRSVTIDDNGVEWQLLFRRQRLTWAELRDYGLSYASWGCVRLYFSPERLDTDGRGRKRLSRTDASVLLHIQNRDKTGQILKVCRRYTRIRPFLCSEEGRLEGVLRDR